MITQRASILAGVWVYASNRARKHQGKLLNAYAGLWIFCLNDHFLEARKLRKGWTLSGEDYAGQRYYADCISFDDVRRITDEMCQSVIEFNKQEVG